MQLLTLGFKGVDPTTTFACCLAAAGGGIVSCKRNLFFYKNPSQMAFLMARKDEILTFI